MTLPNTDELKALRDSGLPADTYARVNADLSHLLSSKLLDEVIQLREGLEHLQRDMQHQPHQYPANAIRSILQGDTE